MHRLGARDARRDWEAKSPVSSFLPFFFSLERINSQQFSADWNGRLRDDVFFPPRRFTEKREQCPDRQPMQIAIPIMAFQEGWRKKNEQRQKRSSVELVARPGVPLLCSVPLRGQICAAPCQLFGRKRSAEQRAESDRVSN